MLHRRGSTNKDNIEAELQARSLRVSKEKEEEKMRLAELAAKEKAEKEAAAAPKVAWGGGSVHSMLDNEYAVSPESASPEIKRAELGVPSSTPAASTAKPSTAPASAKKETPKLPISTGWAPSGYNFNYAGDNKKASDDPAAALTMLSSKGEAGVSAAAIALLGEQLREERKRTAAAEERNAALEAELREMREKLLAAQDKAMAILEREAERRLARM